MRVASLHADLILALLSSVLGVGVTESATEHESEGKRCFARLQLRRSMLIEYYSGTLIYINLYGDEDSDRTYGEGFMSVSVKEF